MNKKAYNDYLLKAQAMHDSLQPIVTYLDVITNSINNVLYSPETHYVKFNKYRKNIKQFKEIISPLLEEFKKLDSEYNDVKSMWDKLPLIDKSKIKTQLELQEQIDKLKNKYDSLEKEHEKHAKELIQEIANRFYIDLNDFYKNPDWDE